MTKSLLGMAFVLLIGCVLATLYGNGAIAVMAGGLSALFVALYVAHSDDAMKTLNETFTDEEYVAMLRVKEESALTWHDFIFSGSMGAMHTYRRGYVKKHKGCGGLVIYVETLEPMSGEYVAECLKCGEIVCEEAIEFKRKQS